MEKKFKKIMSIAGSMFMVGATIGMAAAAGGAFPSPFVKDSNADYAIVYGANAAASDVTGANSLNTYLNTFYSSDITDTTKTVVTGDFSSSVSITNDEIELGSNTIIGSDLRTTIEDNKLSTLLDTKVSWDNGDGTDSYDIHEEILLTNDGGDSKLKVVTNLDHSNGEDLDSYVVLQNDKSLRYRLVFDDLLEFSDDDKEDAKDLMVTILGKEYGITDFEDDFSEITISLSEEKVVKKGTVLNIEGVTLTIGDIFYENIEINGVLIKEDATKRINGIEVQVINIAEHSDSSLSKALIKVGKDIERTVQNGDEYIKGDETWEWDIGMDGDKQYIGVTYTISHVNYDDDDTEENPLMPGQSYIFPENYAAVSFDGLTDVEYNDFEVSFDDRDLYSGDSDTKQNDIDVAILEGEHDDSITLTYDGDEIETDSIYFKYTESGVGIYFKDIDGEVDSEGRIQFNEMYNFNQDTTLETFTVVEEDVITFYGDKPLTGYEYTINNDTYEAAKVILDEEEFYVYLDSENILQVVEGEVTIIYGDALITRYEYTEGGNTYEVTKDGEVYTYEKEVLNNPVDISYNVANLIVDDTEMDVGLDLNADKTVDLTLTADGSDTIKIRLGTNSAKEFKHLGSENEDAESGDVKVGDKSIGTRDYDIMDNYGTIIKDPESNADDDRVILSIPSEQVFAKVNVYGQGTEITETTDTNGNETEVTELGGIIVKDTEINSVKDKNLIIVGGSCINAEAARLLGGKACGEDFTLKTGVTAGKALIQTFVSPHNTTKVATVVAGYNAADTTKAVNAIINSNINIDQGQKHIV